MKCLRRVLFLTINLSVRWKTGGLPGSLSWDIKLASKEPQPGIIVTPGYHNHAEYHVCLDNHGKSCGRDGRVSRDCSSPAKGRSSKSLSIGVWTTRRRRARWKRKSQGPKVDGKDWVLGHNCRLGTSIGSLFAYGPGLHFGWGISVIVDVADLLLIIPRRNDCKQTGNETCDFRIFLRGLFACLLRGLSILYLCMAPCFLRLDLHFMFITPAL